MYFKINVRGNRLPRAFCIKPYPYFFTALNPSRAA